MSSYLKKRVLLFVTKVYWKKMGRGLTYLFIGQFCPILVTFGHFWPNWLATTHFALKIVKSVVNQPRKSMK